MRTAEMVMGIASTEPAPRLCPQCGLELAEFQKTGLLGCALCYVVFEDDIEKLISHIPKT